MTDAEVLARAAEIEARNAAWIRCINGWGAK